MSLGDDNSLGNLLFVHRILHRIVLVVAANRASSSWLPLLSPLELPGPELLDDVCSRWAETRNPKTQIHP